MSYQDRIEYFRQYHKDNKEKINAAGRKWRKDNKERHAKYCKEWKLSNPELLDAQRRRASMKRRGIPVPTRERPENCECCGGKPNGKGKLHMDHDHKTGEFRGWICFQCNTGIGKLGDNEFGLMRAVMYLSRNNKEN